MKKINLFFLIFIVFLLLQGCQPFLKAAMRGDTKTVLDELNRGADVNEKLSAGGGTALILAAEGGHLDTVKALIAKKADINIGDNGGNTALMKAAEKGHLDIVKALIDNKADVNGKNYVDNNALILSLYGGNSGVAKFLIDHGADCNAKNKYGRYPLYYAVNNGDAPIVRSLFDHGVKAGRQDKQLIDLVLEKNNEDIIGILLERNIDVGAKNNRGDATAPSASRKSVLSDVDELPMSKLRANKNSYAIVIGIENYRQKLPAADFATQDARLVSDYLVKVMGYPEENVITLLNDRASHVDMAKYFEKWLPNNVEPGSTVFVYYSGHGAPNPKTSDAYLVPYDGDPSFIEETGYSLKRMYAALGKLPAKEVIVALDSCFSGAGGRSVIAKGSRPLVMNLQSNVVLPKNMTVLSASAGDQTSSTYDEKGHGLFTYFMLKGIKNEDVTRPDGSLKIDDLYSYIKPQVERIARKQYNNEQTPQLIESKKN